MNYLDNDLTPPEILSVRVAAETAVFQVQSVDLQFANGQKRTYERLTPARRRAVMVLPVYQNRLIMIREYAVGSERYELTFPKGLIDAGETPEQAANRELQEEIGFAADEITLLRRLYISPGHMFSPMHVFVAEGLRPSTLSGDEPEPLQQVFVDLDKIPELLAHPEMGDARVLASLFLFENVFAAKHGKIAV